MKRTWSSCGPVWTVITTCASYSAARAPHTEHCDLLDSAGRRFTDAPSSQVLLSRSVHRPQQHSQRSCQPRPQAPAAASSHTQPAANMQVPDKRQDTPSRALHTPAARECLARPGKSVGGGHHSQHQAILSAWSPGRCRCSGKGRHARPARRARAARPRALPALPAPGHAACTAALPWCAPLAGLTRGAQLGCGRGARHALLVQPPLLPCAAHWLPRPAPRLA